jgi:hypothetical protein
MELYIFPDLYGAQNSSIPDDYHRAYSESASARLGQIWEVQKSIVDWDILTTWFFLPSCHVRISISPDQSISQESAVFLAEAFTVLF